MATAKKAAPRKKTAVSGAPSKTKKISGVTYKHKACFTSLTAAKKAAEKFRSTGPSKKARVVKSGKAVCVYTRG